MDKSIDHKGNSRILTAYDELEKCSSHHGTKNHISFDEIEYISLKSNI